MRDCDSDDPERRKTFDQPLLQTAQMFVGEAACWIVVGLMAIFRRVTGPPKGYEAVETSDQDGEPSEESTLLSRRGSSAKKARPQLGRPDGVLRGWRVFLLALPAICDICGTTLMNAGLLMVAASIYQMTRGALVLFVGLFSVWFLGNHLRLFQWLSLIGIVLGVAIVGLAGAIFPDPEAKTTSVVATNHVGMSEAARVVVGIILIAGAQLFTATQFVLEESFLSKSTIAPIEAVAWEGVFGFSVTIVVMGILHAAIGSTDSGRGGMFDMVEAFRQMTENKIVGLSSILIMISIGGFNYFGLSVTRSVSATSRSTIDTCRTLFIWVISLGLGWETFKWLQIIGFAVLVYATFLYNEIVRPPFAFLRPRPENPPHLPAEPAEYH